MGPTAFADGKLVTRKSHRKRPDPGALPIESRGLGVGWGDMQLHGAAAESQQSSWGGKRGRDGLWEPRVLPRDLADEERMILKLIMVTMTMVIVIIATPYWELTLCQALC